MKKIITAIGNENLNNILKKDNNIEIVINDIQYKEGIIEILEENPDIDFIILNNLIQGEISTEELVNKIIKINKKIKIILILEKYEELTENSLYNLGIYKIIYNNKISVQELLKIINENNKITEEDKILKINIFEKKNHKKEIIKNNNIVKYKFKVDSNNTEKQKNNKLIKIILNKLSKNKRNKTKQYYPKIITVIGPNGVGKSIISINLAKINIYSKNKILLVDFSHINNSICTILGIKKYPKNNSENILENIIKVNKKIDFILYKFLINSENKIDLLKINEIKNKYDLIIIDFEKNASPEIIKNIINISNFIMFISDTNFSEISKSINLLKIFINKYKIDKNKFNILFNKYNSESLNLKLLKKIFMEFNIIGHLNYNKNYNKLINKNKKNFGSQRKIRKEYLNINKKISIKNIYLGKENLWS